MMRHAAVTRASERRKIAVLLLAVISELKVAYGTAEKEKSGELRAAELS